VLFFKYVSDMELQQGAVMPKVTSEVETIVRSAHDQIIEGLMGLNVEQLAKGLEWSRDNYSKLDIERLLETAIQLHSEASE
jgi:hypothetical protein